MNQKELTKTFMMISNWERPSGLHDLWKNDQRFKGEPKSPLERWNKFV